MENLDTPPWRLWTLPATLALGLGLWALASGAVAILASAGGSSITHPTSAVNFSLSLVFDVAFVIAALWFTVGQAGARAADFGYRRVPLVLAIAAVALAGIVYYLVTAAYASALDLHGSDKLPTNLGTVGAPVFVCVVAPIAEELFFRGYLFGTLRRMHVTVAGRDVGVWIAALITGVLFGIVHTGSASAQYLVPLGLLGFVLCVVRWRTGSLYPCMALHCLNNALALGVNERHWSAPGVLALALGALAVIAAITGPLAQAELPGVSHRLPD
jgi:membrane protease YdiL (CAAX protease family)